MATDADFSAPPEREPAQKVDPIDELKRIIGEQATDPLPSRGLRLRPQQYLDKSETSSKPCRGE